jgi:hypothetical protein
MDPTAMVTGSTNAVMASNSTQGPPPTRPMMYAAVATVALWRM